MIFTNLSDRTPKTNYSNDVDLKGLQAVYERVIFQYTTAFL